jgi:hypothetical protein
MMSLGNRLFKSTLVGKSGEFPRYWLENCVAAEQDT